MVSISTKVRVSPGAEDSVVKYVAGGAAEAVVAELVENLLGTSCLMPLRTQLVEGRGPGLADPCLCGPLGSPGALVFLV